MKRMLLVDDNETQHELFRCYSMESEFDFSHAVSLDQAVEMLKRQTPDVVILDNRLTPFLDFTETAPILRKAGYEGKIVVISSDVKHPVFEQASAYSIDGYMNKFEISLQNFAEVMNSFIDEAPAAQRASMHH